MRKIALCLSFLLFACNTKPPVDLENLTFKENIDTMLLGHIKADDPQEITSTFPMYWVRKLDGFSYGPFKFKGRGDPDHMHFSNVSFLLNSFKQKKLVGIILTIGTDKEARELSAYILKKNRNPIEITPKAKPYKDGMLYGFNNFLFKDFRPGYTMLLNNHYESEGKKQLMSTEVIVLKSDEPTAVPSGFKTALERVIKTYTNDRYAEQ